MIRLPEDPHWRSRPIHRLGYRSPVIHFSTPTLPCQAGITYTLSTETRQIVFYDRLVAPGKPKGLTTICSMVQPPPLRPEDLITLFAFGTLIMISE